jgi:primosomal protein N' (replication factor Y)
VNYADVILPLPLATYTYRIPEGMTVGEGCRVMVPLGEHKFYTAIVAAVHDRIPPFDVKDIYAIHDAEPVVRQPQLRFWAWLASYYICKPGEVYNAAVPSGLKPEGNAANAFRKKGYSPRMQAFIRHADAIADEDRWQAIFDSLKRAPAQEQLLLRYIDLSNALASPPLRKEISRKELLESTGILPAALDALLKKGILESYDREVSRLQPYSSGIRPLNPLSEAQASAYRQILASFQVKDVCLLHGITSSGKTEIYAHLIADILESKRQVLFLLPEIAITTQITDRLARWFGNKLLVYHSGFSDEERVEVWKRLLDADEGMLVLGVRSSIFLPFQNLGLIIVDEEHENTYKQQDPAPRYHARNAAIVLAQMHEAKTLLGSATPSVETYFNAITGKYGLAELMVRHGVGLPEPDIRVVDIKELRRKKIMKDTLFSPALTTAIRTAIDAGEQVILFRNRRGFAPVVECRSCGWTPRCPYCDVSLTYHKAHRRLECHYCGHLAAFPSLCPSCDSNDVKTQGFGTEKIEEEVHELFPDAIVDRLDFDAARTRSACENIINRFEAGKIQILIGTQMLSKGLDFGNVSVAGILNADHMLNYPDFRAHERAFQLMVQVSGRTGRRDKQGIVYLQTSQPDHPLIRLVEQSSYRGMIDIQLAERNSFRYPPFSRIIELVLRGRLEEPLHAFAEIYADLLRHKLGKCIFGPITPPINRIQNLYIRKIILKIEASVHVAPIRSLIDEIDSQMKAHPHYFKVRIHYDVDPQ